MACSGKCRATLSRRRKIEAQEKRLAEALATFDAIERLARIGRERLEGGG